MTPDHLRERAAIMREVYQRYLERAKSNRTIQTFYWREQAHQCAAMARRAIRAAEALDAEADRLIASQARFPDNLRLRSA